MRVIIFCVLILLTFSNCKKENNPPISQLNLSWNSKTDVESYASSIKPIIYQNIVLYSWDTTVPRNTPLIAYNKINGTIEWEWHDFYETGEYFKSKKDYYLYNNILVINTNKNNIYAINLSNGETKWKIEDIAGRPQIRGFQNQILCSNVEANFDSATFYLVNIDTGNYSDVYKIMKEGDFGPRVNTPLLYENSEGNLCFFTSYSLYNFNNYESIEKSIGYDLHNNTLFFEGEETVNSLKPVIHDNKIYGGVNDGSKIKCYNSNTLELIWEKSSPGGIGWSGISFIGDKLLHGSEGGSSPIICRNSETGNIIWETSGSETSSPLSVYDNKVYFTGGGDGLLHVIDLISGKKLLTAESPDYKRDSGAFFDRVLSIDPETGRIYTANYISALCYEPYGQ